MPKTAERIEQKNLNMPDETRTFEKGKLELVTVGGRAVGRATFQPGWKWSTCVKPIARTKSCEAAHFIYLISGTLKTVADDGTEVVSKPGDVALLPPGHDAWVVGNETVVALDFQGALDYAKKK